MTDYFQSARTSTRAEFVSTFPFLFLVGAAAPVRRRRGETAVFEILEATVVGPDPLHEMGEDVRPPLLVLPVRKQHDAFPSMITVGRTQNNDIVIADDQVSRLHAFFQVRGERLVLSDAGSGNGTWVGGGRLTPKQPVEVAPGDAVRFAGFAFDLLDAGASWDRLRRAEGGGR